MRIVHDAQVEWHFWTTLYPLFKEALPRMKRLSAEDQKRLEIQNAITKIRVSFKKIPHNLRQPQLEQELDQAAFNSFLEALRALLDIFENLVEEKLRQPGHDAGLSVALPQERELRRRYPKLSIVEEGLQTSDSDARANHSVSSEDWPSANYSIDVLLEQSRYIKFHRQKTPDYRSIAEKIQQFNSTVENIFKASLGASEAAIENAALLRDDEVEFIGRAHRWNTLSRSLFTLFANGGFTCHHAHAARIHLSGFLDPDFNLDLLVTACAEQYWHVASCRWSKVIESRLERKVAGHYFCSQPESVDTVAKTLQLKFDHEGMWDDAEHEIPSESILVPGVTSSLCKLVVPGSEGILIFEDEDHKIVELLFACSLLHLNSHWLQAGWDMESILIHAGVPGSQNPLQRWKPYITCSLGSSSVVQHDDNQDILSLGLLIMEMEAKQRVEPTENDKDWVSGELSRDSMLKRALTDSKWGDKLGPGYKQIIEACLRFRELLEKFYDPVLTTDMKRTAAIYKYILAPLHRVITQTPRFSRTSLCSYGFPDPPDSSSATNYRHSGQKYGSDLVLFDDSTWHSDEDTSWAQIFLREVGPFVERIRDLEESCKPSSDWAPWRQEKIRVAIIDTGIDDEDIIIDVATEDGRIKARRNFMNGTDDCKDYYGHGTHVARLLLTLAPQAELYIAKVSNGKSISPPDLYRIAEAIIWACNNKVHIISMSFGLDNRDTDIDKAISIAYNSGITMFAAAANNGGNKPRAYPSNKHNTVICIHASDGGGNRAKINPSPVVKQHNFSTLGISIESRWERKKVQISGTSFATPIAVALAADVLEYARYKCLLSEYEQQCLYHFNGIVQILQLMSKERQGYDYIMPEHIFNAKNSDECIVKKIKDIAQRF
ncbi:hypothetical protein VE00_10597 [Pseudogymnoascus sp. WSF 3629]|nr:hypothetical protein VE00_10597 [Pseudogymnoascus sp. WSF 3629]